MVRISIIVIQSVYEKTCNSIGLPSYAGCLFADSEETDNNEHDVELFTDDSLGFQFEYRVSPNGYILEQLPMSQNDDPDLLNAMALIRITDSEEMKAATGPREGTPTMNFLVFKASNESVKEWLLAKMNFSNYAENTEEVIKIDNKRALYYEWEGLYDGKSVALKHKGNIFLITGTFYSQTEDDLRHTDFDEVLQSIKLY